MPTYTTNYNLVKPLDTEFYNVDDQNSNMDSIDEEFFNLNDLIRELNETKASWEGGLQNAIPDLNEAPDGVFPYEQNTLNVPNYLDNYGTVSTYTGRNTNFRIQIAYHDNSETGEGYFIRRKRINWLPWESAANVIATTAEAQAGTNNTKVMTPLRVEEVLQNKAVLINKPEFRQNKTAIQNEYTYTERIDFFANNDDYGYVLYAFPKNYFSGSIKLEVQSEFANSNAGGAACFVFNVGLSLDSIYYNQTQVLYGSSVLFNEYYISNIFDAGSTYGFFIKKRNVNAKNFVNMKITISGAQNVEVISNYFFREDFNSADAEPRMNTSYNAEIDSLKSQYSNRFAEMASVITGKGVPTDANANASTIINNINAIPTGKRIATGQSPRIDDYFVLSIPFTPSSIQYRETGANITIYNSGQYIKGGTLPGVSQDYSYFVNSNNSTPGSPRVVNNNGGNWIIAHQTIRDSSVSNFSWIAYE